MRPRGSSTEGRLRGATIRASVSPWPGSWAADAQQRPDDLFPAGTAQSSRGAGEREAAADSTCSASEGAKIALGRSRLF